MQPERAGKYRPLPSAPALACTLGPPGAPGGDAYRFGITGGAPFQVDMPGIDLARIARPPQRQRLTLDARALMLLAAPPLAGRTAQARFTTRRPNAHSTLAPTSGRLQTAARLFAL